MKRSRKVIIGVMAIGILLLIFGSKLLVTNDQGYYQVKQAFWTGTMTVRTLPGTYGQTFGKITTYKANATVGFGDQEGDISANLDSIPVVFNEGSYANIAGLIRVKLPHAEDDIKYLLEEFSGGYEHFITSGIVPIVENAVKLGANLRSAQDAYTTLALFQQSVQDQLENGVYVTHSERREIINANGDTEVRQITVISLDADSIPIRQPNRLQELGCEITSCVIDVPGFDKSVTEMIAKRKQEAMKTELAKQAALRAQQDAITAEEQGKADVAKEKYVKEVELIAATTKARENFEVAEFKAKEAAQAKIAKILAAEAVKQELLIADGLSARERYKIDADVKRDIGVAEHMSKWVGPQIVMAGGEGGGSKGSGIENALMIKMMSEMVKSD